MKRLFVAATMAALLALAAAPALAAGAQRFTEDVTGDAFTCSDATYTIVSGQVKIVIHEGESASGNLNVTGTITPRGVVAVDEQGNTYSIQGAGWFGATLNAQNGNFVFTDTEKFTITSPGTGVVGTVNTTTHFNMTGSHVNSVDFNFGNCATPEE